MDAIETTRIRRKPNAEGRIKQLIRERNAERSTAEYMERVAAMLIPLVPKQVVTRILETSKECSRNSNRLAWQPPNTAEMSGQRKGQEC